jgi:hypothetical protein
MMAGEGIDAAVAGKILAEMCLYAVSEVLTVPATQVFGEEVKAELADRHWLAFVLKLKGEMELEEMYFLLVLRIDA